MASWDFFHSERLEVRRGLDAVQVRAALARGELRDGDLIRPAGTGAPWARLADQLALLGPEPPPSLSPTSRIADDRSAGAADRPEPRPEDDPGPAPVSRSADPSPDEEDGPSYFVVTTTADQEHDPTLAAAPVLAPTPEPPAAPAARSPKATPPAPRSIPWKRTRRSPSSP